MVWFHFQVDRANYQLSRRSKEARFLGQHVSFHAENDRYDRMDVPIKQQGITRKGIVVENDCWVGSNAIFLDGAQVGRGCVIAAGVPGRVIETRKQEALAFATEEQPISEP